MSSLPTPPTAADDTIGDDTTAPTVTVVHCWSAPRSRSTALLYSFEARGSRSCAAIDEPLYREWLADKGDAVARPYASNLLGGTCPPAAEIPGSYSIDPDLCWRRELLSLDERIAQAARKLLGDGMKGEEDNGCGGAPRPVVFCKHMAKHCALYRFDRECAAEAPPPDDSSSSKARIRLVHRHVLLIRDPVAVLSSWGVIGDVHGNSPTVDEVGIVPMLSIYSTLASAPANDGGGGGGGGGTASANGRNATDARCPVVILDSDELYRAPEATLRNLCQDLDIPYLPSMMTWKSGPHDCDGPWAPWWYHDVHRSTGWTVHRPEEEKDGSKAVRYRTMPPQLYSALSASYPAYSFLQSLTRGHASRGPPPDQIYEDPRNARLLVYVGASQAPDRGRLVPREVAGISPWDSAVQGGDACWEGLRVYRGKILSLDAHLRRLFRSAKALGFDNVHTRSQVEEAVFRTLAANGMRDNAHIRLTLTRGEKCTSSMNPAFNVYGTTLIVLAEWKPVVGRTTYDNDAGISLISASQRRNSPQAVDSKIHHNNLINNILPKIQANLAGCADALMLDAEGYVSETNATNVFMVDDEGVLLTPPADTCLPGITRATVLELAREIGVPAEVRRLSLAEFHAAEEVFTTGTMGGLTPVTRIDGRIVGTGRRGPVTTKLQESYKTLPDRPGWSTPLPPFDNLAEE